MNGGEKMNDEVVRSDNDNSNKTVATVVYALQAASFILGVTFIIAVVLNYIKRGDVAGSWLASHFKWQIRTFWFALLWTIIGYFTFYILIGIPILLATMVWIIYRIARGWLRLNDGKEMYA